MKRVYIGLLFSFFTIHSHAFLFDSLPSCDSMDVEQSISEIVNKQTEYKFIGLKDIQEIAYNSDSEIRLCLATLATTEGADYVQYHIRWDDEKKSMFWVEFVE